MHKTLQIESNVTGRGRYLGLVCLVASLGGFLFGFHTAVISGTVGMLEKLFALRTLLHKSR